jgi:RNA polymerase subunit RPABC4/transcription elongation factor Spt4
MPIKNKSVGMASVPSTKYCIECGARMSKLTRTCPACGETQV